MKVDKFEIHFQTKLMKSYPYEDEYCFAKVTMIFKNILCEHVMRNRVDKSMNNFFLCLQRETLKLLATSVRCIH